MAKTSTKSKQEGSKKLNSPRYELFAQIYAKDRDCFGNGVQAYMETIKRQGGKNPTYKSAKQQAYRLLTNVDIMSRVRYLMDIYISDEVVDKELAAVILQSGDLSAKIQGIREHNRVKGRLAATKIKLIDENDDLSDRDIEELLAEAEKHRELKEKHSHKEEDESS